MTPSRPRAPKSRKVLTLKHGRGKVHERECRRFKRPEVDLNAYHTVRADQVATATTAYFASPQIGART